jgi:hypothetical protein
MNENSHFENVCNVHTPFASNEKYIDRLKFHGYKSETIPMTGRGGL